MIDFNTVLNTLLGQIIEQASAPLIKRIDDLEAQVKDGPRADFRSAEFCEAVDDAFSNYDINDKFDTWISNGTTFDRAVEAICDDAMSKHEREYDHDEFLTKATANDDDLQEAVKNIINDLDFTISVS